MKNSINNNAKLTSNSQFYQDDEIDIVELLLILKKYIFLIIGIILIGTISTFFYSATITPTYRSSTKFFAPEGESSSGGFSALNNLGFGNIVGGGGGSLEIVVNILNSRRMAKDIVNKFNLVNHYFKNTLSKDPSLLTGKDKILLENAMNAFLGKLNVKKDKSNFITLTVLDTNPQMAADIANYCVKNLDKINEELEITSQKPMVKVLDKAEKPIFKAAPQRKKMILIGFVVSGIMGIFLAFAIEFITNFQKR